MAKIKCNQLRQRWYFPCAPKTFSFINGNRLDMLHHSFYEYSHLFSLVIIERIPSWQVNFWDPTSSIKYYVKGFMMEKIISKHMFSLSN